MRLLDYLLSNRRQGSATIAKDRLQILIARERRNGQGPDYLPALEQEILNVVRKYVDIDRDQVKVNLDRASGYEVLELNITLPEPETLER